MWLIPELVVWKFRNIWKIASSPGFFCFFPLKSFQWETYQWSQKMREKKKKKCPSSHTGTLKNRFSYLDPGDIKDTGLIPGLGRSPGGGHGNLLWYSCLENSLDSGAWRAIVHRVAKSRTQWRWLSTRTHLNPETVKRWVHLSWDPVFCKVLYTYWKYVSRVRVL